MTSQNKIINIAESDLNGAVHRIMRDMAKEHWRPDYVVGITRGGLVPAVMISQYLEVKMHTLDISFRDDDLGPESNLWMAEDAFGYNSPPKNILIVDDINDTGRTLNFIKEDWPSGCLPSDDKWDTVWHNNVRFATIVDNQASEFKNVDYTGLTINKHENPSWVVFPWEQWWEK
jgi:hypoxanthine phosphoribosyltransferase